MPPEKTSQKQFDASAGGPFVNPALFSQLNFNHSISGLANPVSDAILAYPIA
jgi:hypothetical protein